MNVQLVIIYVIVAAFYTNGFERGKESTTPSIMDEKKLLYNEDQSKDAYLKATLAKNMLKIRRKRQTVVGNGFNNQPRQGSHIQGLDNSPTVFVYLEDDKDLKSLLGNKKIEDIINTAERDSQSFSQPYNNNQYYAIPINTNNEAKFPQYSQQNIYGKTVNNARPKSNNFETDDFSDTIVIYEDQAMTYPSEKIKDNKDASFSFYSDHYNLSKEELDFIKSSLQPTQLAKIIAEETNTPVASMINPSDESNSSKYPSRYHNFSQTKEGGREVSNSEISDSLSPKIHHEDHSDKTIHDVNRDPHNIPESEGDKKLLQVQNSYDIRQAEYDRENNEKQTPYNDRGSNSKRPLQNNQKSHDTRSNYGDRGSANYGANPLDYDRDYQNYNRDSFQDRDAQDYYRRPPSYDRFGPYNRGPPYGRGPPSRNWGGPPYRGWERPPPRGRGGPPYGRGRGRPPHREPPYTINLNFPNGTSAAVQYGNTTMTDQTYQQDQNPDVYETLKSIFSPKQSVTLSNDDNAAPVVKVPETATVNGLFQVTPVTPAS